MQTKWRYFLRTLGNPDMDFQTVMNGLEQFLSPAWDAIIEEDDLVKHWVVEKSAWVR